MSHIPRIAENIQLTTRYAFTQRAIMRQFLSALHVFVYIVNIYVISVNLTICITVCVYKDTSIEKIQKMFCFKIVTSYVIMCESKCSIETVLFCLRYFGRQKEVILNSFFQTI